MITVEIADNYFATHLDKGYWAGLTDDKKTGSVTMAEVDITPLMVASADLENEYFIAAVCEQAVYLARNHGTINNIDRVKSESISGAGSASYRQLNQADNIAPRARMFIRRANGSTNLRFGRG